MDDVSIRQKVEVEPIIVRIVLEVDPADVQEFIQNWPETRDKLVELAFIESAELEMPPSERTIIKLTERL